MRIKAPRLPGIGRVALRIIFSGAALNYFWYVLVGRWLFPVPITTQAMQWSGEIVRIGYLWPLMKAINLAAGILLIANRAPAFAVALLLPVTVVIVWFQVLLNPLPVPLVTTLLAVICELVLLHAYASRYTGLFVSDERRSQESVR